MLEHLFNSARKIKGRDFRKRLGCFNYKIQGHRSEHKKPGVIPIEVKQKLLKEGDHQSAMQIKKLERESIYPFGTWNSYGKFIFDPKKVPTYNIPDLEDFKVR
jgi:hypothetical protein